MTLIAVSIISDRCRWCRKLCTAKSPNIIIIIIRKQQHSLSSLVARLYYYMPSLDLTWCLCLSYVLCGCCPCPNVSCLILAHAFERKTFSADCACNQFASIGQFRRVDFGGPAPLSLRDVPRLRAGQRVFRPNFECHPPHHTSRHSRFVRTHSAALRNELNPKFLYEIGLLTYEAARCTTNSRYRNAPHLHLEKQHKIAKQSKTNTSIRSIV